MSVETEQIPVMLQLRKLTPNNFIGVVVVEVVLCVSRNRVVVAVMCACEVRVKTCVVENNELPEKLVVEEENKHLKRNREQCQITKVLITINNLLKHINCRTNARSIVVYWLYVNTEHHQKVFVYRKFRIAAWARRAHILFRYSSTTTSVISKLFVVNRIAVTILPNIEKLRAALTGCSIS